MTVAAGARIGPFEVIAPAGAGGMGEVYRARDPRIGRDVAIKILPRDFAESSERLRRFEQEARTAGSLSHPNLVTIHELGTHDGAPYIVMELLEGATLRDKLRGGRGAVDSATGSGVALPPRKAVEIAVQIANGLAAAHEKGLVHRDLKPENIFVTSDGHAKILDFGLVKLSSPFRDDNTQQPTMPQTTPGVVVGTVGYMSPEQVSGESVDSRSDIFSLGAVLYELLSGRRAFRAPTAVETMNSILHDDPPSLSGETGRVSPSLERIVRRCLEKEPRQRFQSARDLMFALEAIGEASSGSAERAAAPAATKVRATLVAGIAAAAISALAAAFWLGGIAFRPAPPPPKPVPKLVRLTWEPADYNDFPCISPDGASFAYVSGASGNPDIMLRRIGGENPINLTKECPDEDTHPAFSPDGKSIAFRSGRDGGGIFIMGATGESVRRLTDFGFEPDWSPDGRSIAFATHRSDSSSWGGIAEIWIVDVASGARRRVFDRDAISPAWSPSGSRLVLDWRGHRGILGGTTLATIPVTGGEPVPVIAFTENVTKYPLWTAGGVLFVSGAGGEASTIWRVGVDEATGARTGEAELLVRSTSSVYQPSSTNEQRNLLFTAADWTSTFARHGFDPTRGALLPGSRVLVTTPREILPFATSPDGQWIAGMLFDENQQDLVLMRTSDGETRRLTNDSLRESYPCWAPDGSKIYFVVAPENTTEIWSIRPDGIGRELVAGATGGEDLRQPATPSPDGRWLYVKVGNLLKPALIDLSLPVAQRKPVALPSMSDGNDFSFHALSPDGRWLAGYPKDRQGVREPVLSLFDTEKKTYRQLADLKVQHGVNWLPDSRRILLRHEGELKMLDCQTGVITSVGNLGNSVDSIVLSRDGHSLFAKTSTGTSDIWMLDYGESVVIETVPEGTK